MRSYDTDDNDDGDDAADAADLVVGDSLFQLLGRCGRGVGRKFRASAIKRKP